MHRNASVKRPYLPSKRPLKFEALRELNWVVYINIYFFLDL